MKGKVVVRLGMMYGLDTVALIGGQVGGGRVEDAKIFVGVSRWDRI